MYLVGVAKEKSLLSSVNLQDDYDCMAGVNNSCTIFGPQGLAYEGQDQSHPQKPSQVPLGESDAPMYIYTHTHTHREACGHPEKHLSPHHRNTWGRQLKPLHHKRLVTLVAKDQRLRDHAQKGLENAQKGGKHHSFLRGLSERPTAYAGAGFPHHTEFEHIWSGSEIHIHRRSKDITRAGEMAQQ